MTPEPGVVCRRQPDDLDFWSGDDAAECFRCRRLGFPVMPFPDYYSLAAVPPNCDPRPRSAIQLFWVREAMGEAREIYLKACCEVAAALESAGFRWRKSRQDNVREEGDLKFRIWFQSSFRNALLQGPSGPEQNSHVPLKSELFIPLELELTEIEKFGSVSFMPNISVHAASIKKWRGTLAHPIRADDGLADTNVGYLVSEAHWLDVNLANPRTRDGKISAIIDLITESGFQYFDRFRHPEEVVASLVSSSDPGMMDYMELEYAVCYGSLQDAYRVLQRYLRQWPECVDEYQEALREYRRDGIPVALHGRPGPRLARMALALGIEE